VTTDIAAMQVRLAFQEDLLEKLSMRVADQQNEIDQLRFQLNYLNHKFKEFYDKDVGTPDLADEKPPHY